jgi:hypothetical protein
MLSPDERLLASSPACCSIAITLPKQIRQPRDVDGDPPRFVFRQHLGLQRFGFAVTGIDVREPLPVGVADDVAAGGILSARQGAGKRRDVIG